MAALVLAACGHPHRRPWYDPARLAAGAAYRGEEVAARVVLIGDAGYAGRNPAAVRRAREWVSPHTDSRVNDRLLVFLGDNVYPDGMPPEGSPGRRDAERHLDAQLALARLAGTDRTVFLPGNHDWNENGVTGLRAQREYLDARGVRMLPAATGCPGPDVIGRDAVTIVCVDTEWFLQEDAARPASCRLDVRKAVLEHVTDIVRDAGGRPVIMAVHHPMKTHGPHGGFASTLVEGVGLLWKRLFGSEQDLRHPDYRSMVEDLTGAVRESGHPGPVFFVSGHDHGLQVLEGDPGYDYMLVSGSGSRTSGITDGKDTVYAVSSTGFMVLDIMESGGVVLSVVSETSPRPLSLQLWPRR